GSAEAPGKPVAAAASRPVPPGLGFGGGRGASPEDAVTITGNPNAMTGVQAEYAYLAREFPGYRRVSQGLVAHGGRMYDAMTIETASGERRVVYFDVTEWFGRL
ncbi:MAG TPA: hypothetical protein VEH84_17740, partial [Alphaproteobacteria bacterium]|nr:hypothetical protein [Alphaproteobacteria bacterium]